MLFNVLALVGIIGFVGGVLVSFAYMLVVCPIMERRTRVRDNEAYTRWLLDDVLWFKIAVACAVAGLVLCFILGGIQTDWHGLRYPRLRIPG